MERIGSWEVVLETTGTMTCVWNVWIVNKGTQSIVKALAEKAHSRFMSISKPLSVNSCHLNLAFWHTEYVYISNWKVLWLDGRKWELKPVGLDLFWSLFELKCPSNLWTPLWSRAKSIQWHSPLMCHLPTLSWWMSEWAFCGRMSGHLIITAVKGGPTSWSQGLQLPSLYALCYFGF